MMKTAKLITALLALAAVAGCKLNLTADVYSTDLRAVMAGTAGITCQPRWRSRFRTLKIAMNIPPASARSW